MRTLRIDYYAAIRRHTIEQTEGGNFYGLSLDPSPSGSHLHVRDSYLGICAARDGCGVFLADRIEVGADLRSGALVALGEPSVEARLSHYLVMDQPEAASVRARLFAEHLSRELAAR